MGVNTCTFKNCTFLIWVIILQAGLISPTHLNIMGYFKFLSVQECNTTMLAIWVLKCLKLH